jgi:hypothetical protein
MCIKHERAFRKELVKEPARVTPMKFHVDTRIWHDKKNKMPPRLQTRLKNEEIRRQVDAMRSIGIIRDSQASYWSQVLLTPKPNGKWRFCIDYRNLNEATESFGWPIPNIPVMLQRFGAYQAKFFAIFDFTQGYFQCPMSDDSRPYTAFRTQFGLYEWNRVPMGLKSAGSYFQHVMSSSVLGGMIYTMLELYIDDCIIFASSEDELVDRVDKFLTRVIEHNITVNPDKTRMGLEQIEYVGHVLDAYGMHFTQDKLDGVKNFPLPRTPKELRGFIGLVNYFCNHIRQHSELMRPLRNILPENNRQSLKWTAEAITAFEDAKIAVSNCPKLFFMDTEAEVVLCTDASDYGLGAYLYQIKDGKEYPVMFISKSFNT